jgi:hypothetical protein
MKIFSVSLQKWVDGTDCVLPKQIHYNINLFNVFDLARSLLIINIYCLCLGALVAILSGFSGSGFQTGRKNRDGNADDS